MKSIAAWLVGLAAFWIAAGFHQVLAPDLSIGRAQPDFLIVVMTCLSLLGTRRDGMILGFIGGTITGALAGANMTAYALTRTLSGFLVGWFNELEMNPTPILAGFTTATTTLLAQSLLMFGVHRGPILPFLAGTLVSALVNGALAMPIFWALQRLLNPPGRSGFF